LEGAVDLAPEGVCMLSWGLFLSWHNSTSPLPKKAEICQIKSKIGQKFDAEIC
jgi:hypothetical protein